MASLSRFEEGDRDVWRAYHAAYVRVLGVADDRRAEATEALLDTFITGDVWTRVIPGSRDALAALAERGFELAIVSNATGTIEQRLREHGICQIGPGDGVRVQAIMDSAVVGYAKPDPRIFQLALDALGVGPSAAVHVGDTPGADVAGALSAGVRPVLVDPYDDHPDIGVERVASLTGVLDLLG